MCCIDGGNPFQISEDKEPPLDSSCGFFKDGNLINLDYGPSRASVVLWALQILGELPTDYLRITGCEETVN